MAHAGHGFEELLEPRRFGVKSCERIGAAVSRLVLRKSRSERRGETAPKRIQPAVGHLENATDIGWLALVEEKICAGRVVVATIASFEKFQRHERIEKIPGRSRMQVEPRLQSFKILRVFGKFCEEFHLDGAQKRLGSPESQAHLQDAIGLRLVHCVSASGGCRSIASLNGRVVGNSEVIVGHCRQKAG